MVLQWARSLRVVPLPAHGAQRVTRGAARGPARGADRL